MHLVRRHIICLKYFPKGEHVEAANSSIAKLKQAAKDKAVQEEAEKQKAAEDEAQRQEQARIEAERQEALRQEAERQEAQRIEAERKETERVEAARQESARLEAERVQEEKLLECKSPTQCLQKGRKYNDDGDYHRAMVLLQKGCDMENMEACTILGVIINDASGVSRDPIRALNLYHKACLGGFQNACLNVAVAYKRGENGVSKDLNKAKSYYSRGCNLGDNFACSMLKTF